MRGLLALGPAMALMPTLSLPVVAVGEDVADADGSFAAAFGLAAGGGAVLVRPDGHVAARWTEAPADRATADRRCGLDGARAPVPAAGGRRRDRRRPAPAAAAGARVLAGAGLSERRPWVLASAS